jgi:hypothetical protein
MSKKRSLFQFQIAKHLAAVVILQTVSFVVRAATLTVLTDGTDHFAKFRFK